MKPAYFITNNVGGGGTNVARFYDYVSYLDSSSIDLLLNYYYLVVAPSFDKKLVSEVQNFENIQKFLQNFRAHYLNIGYVSEAYKPQEVKWQPQILLDSGSGNFLRDKSSEITDEASFIKVFREEIEKYHAFAEKLGIDITIAFDIAGKYTYKKGEAKNTKYQEVFAQLKGDISNNQNLIRLTLQHLQRHSYKHRTYAPVHGANLDTYGAYLEFILELEQSAGAKFNGFAVGGIGNTRSLDKELWNIPATVNANVKSYTILGGLAKTLRGILSAANDERPIHILGAGGIRSVPFMVHFGVTSFDCHTPWRRASNGERPSKSNGSGGDASWSQILMPLVDSKGRFVSDTRSLDYIKLNKMPQFVCDCPVCQKVSLDEMRQLYSGPQEDHYYAKILLFLHAAWQYDYLIKAVEPLAGKPAEMESFIKRIPDAKLRSDYVQALEILN